MRIIWKGKFDGNEESLPHGEHKPNAVKFQEIDDIKKLGLVLNLLSVPLMIVTYAIVLLRGGFDVILEHFWIYWAGILAAIACLIPHEFIHAMCFRKEAYIYTNLKNGMLFVVAPEDMSKSHFIVMSLMPNLIFGFVPFLLYLVAHTLISGYTGSDFYSDGHRGLLQYYQCPDTDAQGSENVSLWLSLLLVSAGRACRAGGIICTGRWKHRPVFCVP